MIFVAAIGWVLFVLTGALWASTAIKLQEARTYVEHLEAWNREQCKRADMAEATARDAARQKAHAEGDVVRMTVRIADAGRAANLMAPYITQCPQQVRAPFLNLAKALGVELPRISEPRLKGMGR